MFAVYIVEIYCGLDDEYLFFGNEPAQAEEELYGKLIWQLLLYTHFR